MTARRRVRLALGWYHQDYHRGVARFAQQANWHLWSAQALHTALHEGWTGDGFITNGLNPDETAILYRMKHLPTVTIDLQMKRRNVGRVVSDYEAVGRLAFEHFRQRGFEHFAWASRYQSQDFARAVAFEGEIRAAGFTCDQIAWFRVAGDGPRPSHERHAWLVQQVAALPRPVAILAVNDPEAIDILDACEECGLRVPDEVAVMGVGNTIEICDYAPVPLTSIDVAREESGYQAAALLQRLMEGQPPPPQPVVVAPKGVVARLSSDIIAVGHKQVARAVRFIWSNVTRNIGVDDIVDAVGLSRRALFAAFRRHLDRTPHQELMRRRLDMAASMLRHSDMKVGRICEACGFSSLTHLYQAFQRRFGMAPRQYRLTHRAAITTEAEADGDSGPGPNTDDNASEHRRED